ncbi:MAG: ATP-grasp fold amidoligase family protein, partial [Pseudomonadota bacterium]
HRSGIDKLAPPPQGSFLEFLFRIYLTETAVINRRDCLAAAFAIDAPLHERLVNGLITMACIPLTKKHIDSIGSAPNFIRPQSYSEKMQSRKLFDRNPLLRIFCDKLATRNYITSRGFGELLTPLVWSGASAKDIPFDDLSPPYIIKPSQQSGHCFVVWPGEQVDRQQIRNQLELLLSAPHGVKLREWGYASADPQILIEQLLPGKQGAPFPHDYRVTVFSGEVESIRVISRKQNGGVLGSQFSADWEPLDQANWVGYQPWARRWIERHVNGDTALVKPRFLDKMVETAKALSGKIDHLRVDFYETDEQLFLGELTPYHGSGHMLLFAPDADYRDFPPRSIDYRRGELWEQPHWPLWQKLWRAWVG